MVDFRWFNRHARWERDIDVFVDAALSENDRVQFEEHLGACDPCAAQVRDARALKRLLGEGLTEHPAPRSFRITPGMLAETPVTPQISSTPWWPRAAQTVGGLAVAVFALLMVVDLSGTSNDFVSSQSSAGDAEIASAPSDDTATSIESAAPSDGTSDDTVAEALAPAAALDTDNGNGVPKVADDGDAADTESAGGANFGGDPTNERSAGEPSSGRALGGLGLADGADDSGFDGLLVAQISSVVVALAAGIAYLAFRRTRQE